jgi:hypothetical protein
MMSGVRASSMRMLSTFVDDGEPVTALHHVLERELHVVAQVVEAELVVGAVGDVRPVGLLALPIAEVVLDDADREPEEAVDPPHPVRVALGEIVVHGDDVDALHLERVEIARQRSDEGLPLARLHLGDLPAVQHHAADELDVEVAHPEDALARLADDREGSGRGRRAIRRSRPACGTPESSPRGRHRRAPGPRPPGR